MMRTTPPAPHRLNHRGGIGSIRGRARHRHHHRRRPATETDASGTPSSSTDEVPVPVRLLAIVGASSPSHFGYPALLSRPPPTWLEVFSHARDLLRWTDSAYVLDVAEDDDFDVLDDIESRNTYDIVVCVDARAEIAAAAAESVARHGGTSLLSLGEASTSPAVLRLRDSRSPAGTTGNILSFLRSLVLEPRGGLGRRQSALLSSAAELWKRRSADDLVYLLLVLIDALAREVPRVSMTASASPTPDLLYCMLTNCGREVIDCVSDPTCKAALDCLTDCGLNDQVCSYQCIVAYETPLFERFSQCVLQKHNCMGNFAEVPDMPAVDPMTRFRGAEMTHEQAEDILIGWLGEERHSWKVVTGQNAAYDVFPNQHQIFYRGKRKRSFWYDPVFQAKTFEGDLVWRRRHYRVRRGKVPGTFYFSVLDNGVISNEFWRIVDCAEDLEWGLFYYSGAASAAGQSYTGAVFVTRDGMWPGPQAFARIEDAHAKCGIKLWELFEVENYDCEDAPLDPLDDD